MSNKGKPPKARVGQTGTVRGEESHREWMSNKGKTQRKERASSGAGNRGVRSIQGVL